MLNCRKVLFLENSVMEVDECLNFLIALDNNYTLNIIDPNSLSVIKAINLTKHETKPHKYSNSFAISKNGFIFIPFISTKKGLVLKLTKEISKIKVITWHEQDIECAEFSKNSKYFATGGQDGKVFVYNTKNFEPICSLPPRGDYISTISFSECENLCCSSSFDKYSTIFDISRNRSIHIFKSIDVVEKSIFFDNDTKIFLIHRNGASSIYDVIEKKSIDMQNHFRSWPSALDISKDKLFPVVGTRSNALYALRASDNGRLLDIELEYSGVGVVKFFKDMLILGTIEGALLFVDYSVGANELEVALKVKNFKKAREVVDNNLFLSINPLMSAFDTEWPNILKKSVSLLNNNSIDEAVELVEPFVADISKKKEFDFYLKQKDVVALFAQAVESKDFQKAYEYLSQHNFLSKTMSYIELDNYWNRLFNRAKNLLEENPLINQRSAAALLKPFENTPKRELIQYLIKNSNIFSDAEKLIKKGAFKAYFELTAQNRLLKESELYKKVLALGEKLMDEYRKLEESGHYKEAQDKANLLMTFPEFKKSISTKLMMLKNRLELLQAIEKKNIKRAYDLVDNYESLKAIPEFKELTKEFEAIFESALSFAYKGKPARVIMIFGEYMSMKYWRDKISSAMKIAYIHEMANHIIEEGINWDMTVKRYVLRFGKDDEINKLLKDSKLERFLDAIEGDGDKDGYISKKYPEEIIIYKTNINE